MSTTKKAPERKNNGAMSQSMSRFTDEKYTGKISEAWAFIGEKDMTGWLHWASQ